MRKLVYTTSLFFLVLGIHMGLFMFFWQMLQQPVAASMLSSPKPITLSLIAPLPIAETNIHKEAVEKVNIAPTQIPPPKIETPIQKVNTTPKKPVVKKTTEKQIKPSKIEKPVQKVNTTAKKPVVKKTIQKQIKKPSIQVKENNKNAIEYTTNDTSPASKTTTYSKSQTPAIQKTESSHLNTQSYSSSTTISSSTEYTPTAHTPAAPPIQPPSFKANYLHNPAPAYPRISERLGETGKVLLKVKVNPQGRAATVTLHQSSGFKRLDKAAVATVKNWRFVPAKQGNTPVSAWVIVPINFRL